MQNVIPVESIRERDIDLLLIEELTVNDSFLKWFITQCNLPISDKLIGAWRSITDFGLGETDILLAYQSNQKIIYVQIENKLDADFQIDQHLRYKQRGENYIKQSTCDQVFSILCAPKTYIERQSNFELTVTYESILHFFESNNDLRLSFKAQLLKIAIEKLRRGYQPVNSVPVKEFWSSYFKMVEKEYPMFTMRRLKDVIPHDSDWPMLYDNQLPHVTFYHKWKQGNVDATFKKEYRHLIPHLIDLLPEDISIKDHKKSFSLRISACIVDRTALFEDQHEAIRDGLNKLIKLSNWLRNNSL
ncbi:hypothetical protein OBK27_13055 [Empedobacter falsenii]